MKLINLIKTEITLAKIHLAALLKDPFSVPTKYDKDGLHYHYFICMMLTILTFIFWSIIFKELPFIYNVLFTTFLSFVTILIIAYLKELIIDKWIRKTYIDVDDIRFSMYGWAAINLLLLPFSIINNWFKK